MEQFNGTPEELQDLISEMGYSGQWSSDGSKHVFKADSRSIHADSG